jgi:hypothetical protein
MPIYGAKFVVRECAATPRSKQTCREKMEHILRHTLTNISVTHHHHLKTSSIDNGEFHNVSALNLGDY